MPARLHALAYCLGFIVRVSLRSSAGTATCSAIPWDMFLAAGSVRGCRTGMLLPLQTSPYWGQFAMPTIDDRPWVMQRTRHLHHMFPCRPNVPLKRRRSSTREQQFADYLNEACCRDIELLRREADAVQVAFRELGYNMLLKKVAIKLATL